MSVAGNAKDINVRAASSSEQRRGGVPRRIEHRRRHRKREGTRWNRLRCCEGVVRGGAVKLKFDDGRRFRGSRAPKHQHRQD
jgi:hypothetical protein